MKTQMNCRPPRRDAELAQRVQRLLSAKRGELRGLFVSVERGAVTLAGGVRSYYAKQVAIHLVKELDGVDRVVDRMTVAVAAFGPSADSVP